MHYNNTHITFCVCVCAIRRLVLLGASLQCDLFVFLPLRACSQFKDLHSWCDQVMPESGSSELWHVAFIPPPCEIWLFLDNLGQFTNPRLWSLHQSQSKPAIFVEGDQVISLFELLTGLWNQDCLSERKIKNGLEFHWECALVSLLD